MSQTAPDSPAFGELPIVDLARWRGSDTERRSLAAEVADVCHHVGFFVVVGHGIDSAFIDSVFSMMRIDKRRSRHFRSWEAVGTEFTNNRPDIREQVDLWSEPGPGARCRSGVPPAARAESVVQRRCTARIRRDHAPLVCRVGAVADELLGVMSLGLEVDEGYLSTMFGAEPMSLTKLIRYPPTPGGSAGVNAHHDTGSFTLLAPGETPGLQIENQIGEWIAAPSVPGAFVVNLGEMLQGLTANYFRATPHRVITSDTRSSAAYFHGPSLDTPLVPLPLAERFCAAVAASPRHADAGFMASAAEMEAGVDDVQSAQRAAGYGEQLWNYFTRRYPDLVAAHYPDESGR